MKEAFALIAAILLLLSTGCVNLAKPERPINGTWSAKETPADYLTHENKDKGFSMRYPPQWEMMEASAGEGVLSPLDDEADAFRENVVVVYVLQPSTAVRLDQLQDAEMADIKKTYPSLRTVASEKIMFKGNPAYRITALVQNEGVAYKDQFLIILNGSREYIILYTATEEGYERHLETAEQIMGSFQMT